MGKRKWTTEQLKNAVLLSYSIASVIKALGLKPTGGNYTTINNKIKELKLDTSHFTGKGWNVGLKFNPSPPKPLKDILSENSNYLSYKLLKRLFKENLKERKCECCNNTEWFGKPMPLELHHINGIHSDNRFENLQVLCPNCHALTDNYRGKNKSAQNENSEAEGG